MEDTLFIVVSVRNVLKVQRLGSLPIKTGLVLCAPENVSLLKITIMGSFLFRELLIVRGAFFSLNCPSRLLQMCINN